jgi:hypothetical protein
MPNYGIPVLVKTAATHIKDGVAADGKATEQFQRAAVAIVGIRRKTLVDGQPDWAGRSAAYREHMAEVYKAAGIPEDSQANVQARLRYHISNALHEHVPNKDLLKAGLSGTSARDRAGNRQANARQAATVLRSAAPSGSMLEAVQQASAMLQHASTLPQPTDETERANLGILLLTCESVLSTLRQATIQAVPTEAPARKRTTAKSTRKATAKAA